MLFAIALLVACHHHFLFIVCLFQLGTQDAQRLGQIFFFEDRMCLENSKYTDYKKNENLFHSGIVKRKIDAAKVRKIWHLAALHQNEAGHLPAFGDEVEVIDRNAPAVFHAQGVAVEVIKRGAPTVFLADGLSVEIEQGSAPAILLAHCLAIHIDERLSPAVFLSHLLCGGVVPQQFLAPAIFLLHSIFCHVKHRLSPAVLHADGLGDTCQVQQKGGGKKKENAFLHGAKIGNNQIRADKYSVVLKIHLFFKTHLTDEDDAEDEIIIG